MLSKKQTLSTTFQQEDYYVKTETGTDEEKRIPARMKR
jgi:hypothetical protein|tara:strand:+ start:823 stop:936 length:114 start_codon:yes stop_codon:yes gene_type:complete